MSDFWSRRKKAVEEAAAAEDAATEARRTETEDAAREAAQAEMSDAELLDSLGLPDPDAMKSGDDIAAFMAREVPRHIRNRALRSLWRSNPVLACVDGLNDYDDDFTGDGLNGGPLKTSYEVGKGLAAHVRKMAEAAEADANATDEAKSDEIDQEIHIDAGAENSLDESPAADEGMPEDTVAEEATVPPMKAPRRMRFTFEEDDRE